VKGVPEQQPPPPPPPEPVATSLTATCPTTVSNNEAATVTGKLSPAFAGATVTIKVTAPDLETQEPGSLTFTQTATTDASGNWSTQIDTDHDEDPGSGDNGGTWKVEASYGGDAGHKPSAAPACTFQEIGN
jgi:hypothetical protein